MSMKKKFLALALAGAVAMPVVANASTNVNNFQGDNTSPLDANLTIKGSVQNAQGQAPAGKLQVELPTAVSFTVDQAGNFQSAGNFKITNKSTDPINIDVAQFSDTRAGGITFKERSELGASQRASLNRANVSIILNGNGSNTVDLGTVMKNQTTDRLVDALPANDSINITIDGVAGTKKETNPVDTTTSASLDNAGTSEDFTLRFVISKHS